ncbi:hypothetical protein SNEBB_003607 [Seison nebaliae]|nr:hypothetical protein SNEBB_003607 [Seison nebaliae]
MACLYIASKVEEEEERIFTTTQFVAATNMPTMQIQDMCRVELLICKRLKFNINSPTSIQYIIPILLKTNRLLLNEYELMNDSLRDLLDEKSENFLKLFHNIELLIVKCALLPLMNSFNPLTVAMCCISFVPEYVDRLSDPHQSGNWLIFLVKLLKEYSVDFIKFIQCRKCLMKRIPNIIYFIFSAKNGVLMINDEMLNKYHHHHHHHHPEHENLKTIVENKKSENFENEINNTKIHKINMNTTTTTTTTSANINSRRIMRSFRKRYQKKKKNKSMGNNSTIPLMLNEKKSSWNQFPLDDDDESSSNTISNTTINQTILPSIQEQQQQQSWKRLRTITNESLGQQTIDDSIDTGELNDIYDAKILKIADLTLISSTLEQENHHINTPCKMEHNHDIGTYAEVLTRNYKNHTKV